MKRNLCVLILFLIAFAARSQEETKISTIDYVQILEGQEAETIFYYENNWKVLREMAKSRGYIDSFQLLETPFSEEAPFHLMLVTTYLNEDQYKVREEKFNELISEKGGLSLLNHLKPSEFRKTIFSKENVIHLE